MSRRAILTGSAALAGGILVACAPAAAPTATPAPAAKPAAPAAAATPAAAGAATPAAAAKPAAGTTPAAAGAATPAAAAKPAAGTTPAPAAATKPASGQQVTIRTHDWAQDPQGIFYPAFWKKFEDTHPNIKLQHEWFPRDEMHTKILSLAATGQIGDTVRINVAVLTPELRNKEVIQSLTPFINRDTQWNQNDHKQFWPGNIANYTAQGQQWGYPLVGHPGQNQYYSNVTALEAAGVQLPVQDGKWTQEQAIEIFKKGTKSEGGRTTAYGIWVAVGGEGTVANLRAFGGDFYNLEGTKALVGSKESIEGIKYIQSLFQTHKVAVPFDPKSVPDELFQGGRALIRVSTSGSAGTYRRIVGNAFKWTILPPPIGPSGQHETQVSSDGLGMAKLSKNPDEAWEVIKAYASLEHGVERHLAGFGSPGSRYDVWTHPKFKEQQPELSGLIYNTMVDPQKAPPLKQWNHPANGRYFETDAAINNILADVWLGNKTPEAAAAEAQSAAQAIMDRPPV
jgi:ABC-type glycerol-3-phosphate transport system substrate-binding protein